MHFSELVKGICHLSAARRQIGRKIAYILVSEKLNLVREKSVKSQGILFLHEGGHPANGPLVNDFYSDIFYIKKKIKILETLLETMA